MILYRIVNKFLGCSTVFQPQDYGDTGIKRICTAPSVAQAILALPQGHFSQRMYVYRTNCNNSQDGTEWDQEVTNERIILVPSLFHLCTDIYDECGVLLSWIYGDSSDIDSNYLNQTDRNLLLQIKLRGIKAYLCVNYPSLETL